MAFVPLILAGAKKYTNVYCPAQLSYYCGNKPYVKILSSYPADFDRGANAKGRCFPAGHASGGFALMALFFCFKRKKYRLAGLGAGLCAGWAMGLYQILRGEHFLSHTLVTMLGAWLIILCLVLLLRYHEQL
jgi:membrane-associated PAP2 superfamily phosphatase